MLSGCLRQLLLRRPGPKRSREEMHLRRPPAGPRPSATTAGRERCSDRSRQELGDRSKHELSDGSNTAKSMVASAAPAQSAGQVERYLRRPNRVVTRRSMSVSGRGSPSEAAETALRQTMVTQ